VMVELPLPAVSVTVLPLTGWLNASMRVTVMVDSQDYGSSGLQARIGHR
jgi:hypothetical protein